MTKAKLLAALPEPGCRFTPLRKAAILDAVNGKAISRKAALKRYNISEAEFANWTLFDAKAGTQGLRVTRCQQYRKAA